MPSATGIKKDIKPLMKCRRIGFPKVWSLADITATKLYFCDSSLALCSYKAVR